MSGNPNKFHHFDLFKTIGTFVVFSCHILNLMMVTKKLTTWYSFIFTGIGHQVNDLFFFISGYLSALSYMYQLSQTTKDKKELNIAVDFILKRLYRLAPLMYVVVFAQKEFFECTWNELLSYLSFTHAYTNQGKI